MFKVGDKVRAVKNHGRLRTGETYTVVLVEPETSVSYYGGAYITVEGNPEAYFASRFELIPQTRFKVGDRVRRTQCLNASRNWDPEKVYAVNAVGLGMNGSTWVQLEGDPAWEKWTAEYFELAPPADPRGPKPDPGTGFRLIDPVVDVPEVGDEFWSGSWVLRKGPYAVSDWLRGVWYRRAVPQAVTASPVKPTSWRLLSVGEMIEKGDEHYFSNMGGWSKVTGAIGQRWGEGHAPIRRVVPDVTPVRLTAWEDLTRALSPPPGSPLPSSDYLGQLYWGMSPVQSLYGASRPKPTPLAHPFKVGDWVRCVEAGDCTLLQPGKVYQVRKTAHDIWTKSATVDITRRGDLGGEVIVGRLASRFVPVKRVTETKYEIVDQKGSIIGKCWSADLPMFRKTKQTHTREV